MLNGISVKLTYCMTSLLVGEVIDPSCEYGDFIKQEIIPESVFDILRR